MLLFRGSLVTWKLYLNCVIIPVIVFKTSNDVAPEVILFAVFQTLQFETLTPKVHRNFLSRIPVRSRKVYTLKKYVHAVHLMWKANTKIFIQVADRFSKPTCLSCHRFRDTSSSFDASSKRYVITNPPDNFLLHSTDQVSINQGKIILSDWP